jgi:hypothetical protein
MKTKKRIFKTKLPMKQLSYEEMGEAIQATEKHLIEVHPGWISQWRKKNDAPGLLFNFSIHLCALVQYGKFHSEDRVAYLDGHPIVTTQAHLAHVSFWIVTYEDWVPDPRFLWTREELIQYCLDDYFRKKGRKDD